MNAMNEIMDLFNTRAAHYDRFIAVARYSAGLESVFRTSEAVKKDMRILDAGCGTGAVTFALLRALHSRGLAYTLLDAFDLNETMLQRFQRAITEKNVLKVTSCKANVLHLEQLPPTWSGYDLIVSSGMLEYLDHQDFERALKGLREHLSTNGTLIVFVSRDNWIMRWLIKKWWRSHLYTAGELRACFSGAGYREITDLSFPAAFSWLNLWGSRRRSQVTAFPRQDAFASLRGSSAGLRYWMDQGPVP
jgi:SAM-dependent methyltransferase